MNIIFSTLIVIIIVLLFAIFAGWIDKFNAKYKEAFIEKTLDRKEAFIDKSIEKVLDKTMDQHKTGPWFLVVLPKTATIRFGFLTTISAACIPTRRTDRSSSSSSVMRTW